MAYSLTSNLLIGQFVAQIWRLDSNNYQKGTLTTPDSPSNGTSYNPYVIPAAVGYEPASPTFVEFSSYANMAVRAKVDGGVTDFGTGTLTLSEMDDTFDKLVMGYTGDVATATNLRIRARNIGRKTPRRFGLALTRQAATSNNVLSYETIVLLNVTFRGVNLGTGQANGQNQANLAYQVIPAKSTRLPWGKALTSATNLIVDGNADTEISVNATAPMAFTTYVDDGSATTFTLPYTPDSTEHAGATNIIMKNGSTATVTSISGTTVTITAGSAGDIWNVAYPSTALLTA